ncbi:MAG TPA: hypothetical protein VGS80_00870 [Ktedonobacterales bacterium]|nr:hypothetical protein [Ktedonobacterales bacterium]
MSTDHNGTPLDNIEVSDLAEGLSPHLGGSSRPTWRNLLRLGMALLALALTAGALIARERIPGPSQPVPTPTAAPVAPFLPLAGLGCVNDAAWAPTSDLIALVGSPDIKCGYGGYAPNVVNIYRARTASLVRQLHPDPAVFTALGVLQPAPATPVPGGNLGLMLRYSTVRWSPDGTRLALSVDLSHAAAGSNPQRYTHGLVLLDADGTHEHLLVNAQPPAQPATTIWDLQTGTTVAVPPDTLPVDAPYSTLSVAQSYRWGAGGALVPGAPFAAGRSTPAPTEGLVGTPNGFAPFGPWQPGSITVFEAPTSGQGLPSYLYLYDTTFAAWSPDGRYLATGLSVLGLLLPAGALLPPPSVLSALQLQHIAALPIRDAALREALAHDIPLPAGQPTGFVTDVPLAWRADGKVLAVLNAHNGFILRATQDGRVVKSVAVMQLPVGQTLLPGYPGSWATPLWSPDGTWLLLPTLALVNTSRLGV